jgi:hypothetical protein
MKFLVGMKERAKKWLSAVSNWAMAQIDKGKKSQSGVLGWVKTGAILLAATVAVLGVVALIIGFFLFCLSIPGLLFGSILWVGWTWAGLGAELFPQLDPRWLTLNWQQFFWLTIVVYYAGKALGIRRGKAPAKS